MSGFGYLAGLGLALLALGTVAYWRRRIRRRDRNRKSATGAGEGTSEVFMDHGA